MWGSEVEVLRGHYLWDETERGVKAAAVKIALKIWYIHMMCDEFYLFIYLLPQTFTLVQYGEGKTVCIESHQWPLTLA